VAGQSTVSWPAVRHAVVFLLGCAVILDAISQAATSWPEVAIGAVMVGCLPLDRMVLAVRGDRPDPRRYRQQR
jgi:peptidoglycan/LPS O-acetylase OafA/YrhL